MAARAICHRSGKAAPSRVVPPVEDVMVSALLFAHSPGPVRADVLRRALGRVTLGLSPRLDTVIERAGAALARPHDAAARQALYVAAKELPGVRVVPVGQQLWWDR